MKSRSIIYFINFFQIYPVYIYLFIFFIPLSENIYAGDDFPEKKIIEIEDTSKNNIAEKGYTYFGFHTGVVLTDYLDTGFGFGGRLARICFSPMLELTTSGYLWGASRDSIDVTTFGIEESLTVKKSHSEHISLFSGIIAGYYFKNKKIEIVENSKLNTTEKNNNSLEVFITFGGTYLLASNRTIFTRINYGLTQNVDEIHIQIGMNFPLKNHSQ